MIRKSLYLALATVLLLVVLSPTNVALAQRPDPPKPGMDLPDGPPKIDQTGLSEPVQNAITLQESLTAEQHAAVRQVLDKYLPEMEATTEALFAADKPAPGAEPQPVDRDITGRVQAMLRAIDAEMAVILDADQLKLHQAVMRPDISDDATPEADDSPGEPQDYTSYCYDCAYYGAYADSAAWLAYVYAYYDYYYYGYSYAYYTMDYAYSTYLYSKYSLDYSGPTYFLYYFFGQYGANYPYYAYYYAYYAEEYGYYAYLYGYYNYNYYGSGSTYGYYAYLYSYYAYYGADYAHYNCYYCYYYS